MTHEMHFEEWRGNRFLTCNDCPQAWPIQPARNQQEQRENVDEIHRLHAQRMEA